MSGIAGAGAGIIQGLAFTPVENLVRLLRDSATSTTGLLIRTLRLPIRANSPLNDVNVPSNPLQAIKTFLSSSSWKKNDSWWHGWKWTVGRDALSYSCFFAAFDVSRRVGLRVRSAIEPETPARVAQAATIVTGGVTASLAAEFVGRPFREAQRLAQQRITVRQAIRQNGYRPFFIKGGISTTGTILQRTAWRLAAVGPWGFGFLVWAWVGDEI